MAAVGTLSSETSASIGPWAEFTTVATITVTSQTTATTATVTTPSAGSGSLFNPNLPVSVCVLNSTITSSTIQGNANNGLNAALGVSSVTISTQTTFPNVTTLTFSFVNSSGGSVTIPLGTRFLCYQAQGL